MNGFWKTWMHGWCWATLAFGAVLAAAAIPALDGPTRIFYDLIHWPIDGQSSFVESTRFTTAVLGAVMLGWALTLFTAIAATAHLPARAAAQLWRGLTGAMITWYVVDSAASVATGAPVNAASNTVFLISFLVPVFASGALGGRRLQTA